MNCIFSAQKVAIPIDVCKVFGPDAVFLQQASHLTGGGYYRLERRAGLLQYLMVSRALHSAMGTRLTFAMLADGVPAGRRGAQAPDPAAAGAGRPPRGVLLPPQDHRRRLRLLCLLVKSASPAPHANPPCQFADPPWLLLPDSLLLADPDLLDLPVSLFSSLLGLRLTALTFLLAPSVGHASRCQRSSGWASARSPTVPVARALPVRESARSVAPAARQRREEEEARRDQTRELPRRFLLQQWLPRDTAACANVRILVGDRRGDDRAHEPWRDQID